MDAHRLHLLIVEDKGVHVEAIRHAFGTAGVEADIQMAGTLREYRELLVAYTPDLALVDLNLPDGHARETLTHPPEAASFPVLVMTSLGSQQLVAEMMKAGALDCVVKSPEAFDQLPHTVAGALREWKLLQGRRRAEAVLRLVGGIAHDLNNILAPILMTTALLRETVSDPENRSLVDTLEMCAQRGVGIIKQLLAFARGEPGGRVVIPMRQFLSEIAKLIRTTFPRNIRMQIKMSQDLWPVLGDFTQIHQAFMSLCANACAALPEGGTVTLAAANVTLNEAFAAMQPDAKPGPYVCASVTDTGPGIDPEDLERIFDPILTTKAFGKDISPGLAAALGIARDHGGFVRVSRRMGHGTTFELCFPAIPETNTVAKADAPASPPRGRD